MSSTHCTRRFHVFLSHVFHLFFVRVFCVHIYIFSSEVYLVSEFASIGQTCVCVYTLDSKVNRKPLLLMFAWPNEALSMATSGYAA